jgi:acyl-CoA reductase-like NAD-dependent aldehyde dehydrogenase
VASIWHEDRLLIDGELVGAEGGATFDTISPSTEDVLGTAANASMGDTKRAISAARRAFDITEWSRDVALRRHCLQQLHQALVDNAEQLRTIVVQEVGAPVMLTYGPQLDSPTALVGWYADLLDRYDFSTDLGQGEFFGSMHHRWMEREAAGVVAAITAYNYPIQLALAKLAPALAAGCSVVLKAAPDTPWSALALGKLAAEATDLPPGVLNVLASDDNAVGVELTTNPDIDLISFTGSTAVGRAIQAAAAPTVKKVFLELGGKSASVVLDDADLAMAATFCAFAVMSHAGQGCAITTRLVVPRERYDEAVQTAATVMAAGKVGNPAEPDTMVGPLINARQREKVAGYVERAVAAGAVVAGGGKAVPGKGFFFEPTVLAGVDANAEVAQDELFGPVLVVLPHDGDDDAVRIANNSIYGLSTSVTGADRDRALGVARRIRAGTVSVNGGAYFGPETPFGGYKQSGTGRESGVAGLEEFLEIKAFAEPAG